MEPRIACVAFAVAGAAMIALSRRSLLGDERLLFKQTVQNCSDVVKDRVAAALARRRNEEQFMRWPALIAFVVLATFGMLGYFRVLDTSLAIMLEITALFAAMSVQVFTVRRIAGRQRTATLAPRTLSRLTSPWYLTVPVVTIGIALWFAFLERHALVLCAVSIVVAVLTIVTSEAAVRMPAIVSVEDPIADEVVDRQVRSSRLRGLLMVSLAPVYVLAYQVSSSEESGLRLFILIATLAALFTSGRATRLSQNDLNEMVGVN